MPTVSLFSFTIADGDREAIARTILFVSRLALQPVAPDTLSLPLRLHTTAEGRFSILANIDDVNLATSESLQKEAIQRVQCLLVLRVAALGWPTRQYQPCPPKVAASGAAMFAHTRLRTVLCETTIGASVLFFSADGTPQFSVILGGRFREPRGNLRSQFFGQVSHVSHTRRYRTLHAYDITLGKRSILLPDRVAKIPAPGTTIFAVLTPLRDSRLSWQLESYFAIQRKLFGEFE